MAPSVSTKTLSLCSLFSLLLFLLVHGDSAREMKVEEELPKQNEASHIHHHSQNDTKETASYAKDSRNSYAAAYVKDSRDSNAATDAKDSKDSNAAASAKDSTDSYATPYTKGHKNSYAVAYAKDYKDSYAAAYVRDARDSSYAANYTKGHTDSYAKDSRDSYAAAYAKDSKDSYAASYARESKNPYEVEYRKQESKNPYEIEYRKQESKNPYEIEYRKQEYKNPYEIEYRKQESKNPYEIEYRKQQSKNPYEIEYRKQESKNPYEIEYRKQESKNPYEIEYRKQESGNTDAASNKVDHAEAFKTGFFSLDDLYVGNRMTLQFTTEEFPHFLKRKEADSIPFSTSQLPSVLQLLSVPQDSSMAQAMRGTLGQCELPPLTAETKVCVSSLESMIDFVRSVIGSDSRLDILATTLPATSRSVPLQRQTVLEISPDFYAPKWVACHPLPYPYAVYYCHFIGSGTKIFKVKLGSENGEEMEALGVCHLDTSEWDPDHILFKQLGFKAGEAPVCHFLPVKHLMWIPLPSEATM
ncbi:hypothetical protein QN277_001492 [Acacia crassicarpa]|uniref:BURP domain-containing protein n=1 Tax=Acacia crassicarpa TaxID=499986 RepID=A0AAE1N7F7_9FABA|nr:hypothetical protein QN277_001492 [Acacia crassicarpa]